MRSAFLTSSAGPKQQKLLKYTSEDESRLRKVLSSQECGFEVNEQKNYANISELEADISQFLAAAGPEDSVLFYFSGHGDAPKGDLMFLYEFSDMNQLAFTALTASWLRDRMKHCRARNKLIILDCCKAGAIYDTDGTKSVDQELDLRDLNLESSSHLAFVSGSRFELAREDDTIEASVFTHFLVQALTKDRERADFDKDGLISVQDLEQWISEEISRFNEPRDHDKLVPRPYIVGEQRGKYFLTLSPDAAWHWPTEAGFSRSKVDKQRGRGASVVLVDTGIDADHYQFRDKSIPFCTIGDQAPNVVETRGFDIAGHGTGTASIVIGEDIGVAPRADLQVAAVLDRFGGGSSASLINGLTWLYSDGRRETKTNNILLIPLGFPEGNRIIEDLLKGLSNSMDVLIVAPVGNAGTKPHFPASLEQVLSVGTVDNAGVPIDGQPELTTDKMIKPEIFGYGMEIPVAIPRGYLGKSQYEPQSGGSRAAAYVAGVAALYQAQFDLSGERLKDKLLNTALPIKNDAYSRGIARFLCN